MLIDAQLLFSDAQALTVDAVSTNLIDLGTDRNIGLGEPLSVVVVVDVAAAGGGTLAIIVQADDNSGFASATTVATTAALAAASLTAGARVVIPIPPDTLTERYVRLSYDLTTMTGITLTAFLQPTSMADTSGTSVFYPRGYTIS
jgi:hypothetical protein